MVDALIEDKEYASMGERPADRVKNLLGRLNSVRGSEERGYRVKGKQDRRPTHMLDALKKSLKLVTSQ
jgi:hypothetical protein